MTRSRFTAAELRTFDQLANADAGREELKATRARALEVDCEVCGQEKGQPCVRSDGSPVPYPAHWHRLMKADRLEAST